MADRIKILWLGKKHQDKYICYIPLTIDGQGRTVTGALENLSHEAKKIVSALNHCGVKCNFTPKMIDRAIAKESWWKKPKTRNGVTKEGTGGRGHKYPIKV